MTTPQRIQRRRTKGWRAPEDAVYVGRGSHWGNPTRLVYRPDTGGWHAEHDNGGGIGTFPNAAEGRRFAADAFRAHLALDPALADRARRELAGRDLMCWCPLPEPGQPDHCHAAVLLDLATTPAPAAG
ncbi:DUF4326 domain-containing protein [Streptomyces rubiginosohelvolus]|uniref:DUF4326 domain-containing protein n=1 Tax=Streptomyces rubiginosohelvolus TaxID=67362 RepID=UPI003658076C